MEGESVILHTGVKTNQQDRIRWYFNDTRIAQITKDLSKICTDVQCNEGTERFRDRLKLDNQTGSLTILNIRTTESGVYKLLISSSNIDRENSFSVIVHDVPAAEQDKMKRKSVKEGESITLHLDGVKKTNNLKIWYFNDTLITEITGDQSKICTDEQCKERFRDRLKLNDQTGSLTIINTRTTDSGLYKLQINSSRFSIIKTFSVTVTAVPDSSAAAVVVVAAVLLVAAAEKRTKHNDQDQENSGEGRPLIGADREKSTDETNTLNNPSEEKSTDETNNTLNKPAEEKPSNETNNTPNEPAEEKPSNETNNTPNDPAEEKPTNETNNTPNKPAEEKPTDETNNTPNDPDGVKPTNETNNTQTCPAGGATTDQAEILQMGAVKGADLNNAKTSRTSTAKGAHVN
ncbi:uncharacterized protein LOC107690522 [Sinocyclocheilus anshuiensis]|uniref:uncharacterized protein LOC107690522 n=1 Tax=Sinocyclocheilus anshuiensis TaxID=1608454 RepID=UPI0007BAA82D|nr:PREDICTED: uncharacterized protein LOC107690522 [Sinocyclocheilus anshuiensis]